ncbi:DUF1990 family protein [Streptomyces sp. NPDC003247]|uniref:DUF1990 family protein n=1 Tax=Streptomyces sp. NPDC003247 TaxID=3364677 RepID=UPI0036B8BDFA
MASDDGGRPWCRPRLPCGRSADGLSYGAPGATSPASPRWRDAPAGFRRFERTVTIGVGEGAWAAAREAVMRWEVKRRSGFDVAAADGAGVEARTGGRYTVTVGLGPLVVREPVEVVAVVDDENRCGFAYGTRWGHPVSGEEAFIAHRGDDGRVRLTLRSLTRAAPTGPWRLVYPVLLLAQRCVRVRYLRALI